MLQAMNFFGAVQLMIMRLQTTVLGAFQTVVPQTMMMNLVWTFIGGFFLWHFFEATFKAFSNNSGMGLFEAYWDLIRQQWLRVVIHAVLAVAVMGLVNGTAATQAAMAPGAGSWANVRTQGGASDLATDTSDFLTDWVGNNQLVIVKENGVSVQEFQKEAPVIQTLDEAIKSATTAVDSLAASDVYDRVDDQIQNALDDRSRQLYGAAIPTWAQPGNGDLVMVANPAAAGLALSLPLLKGIMYIFNWFTFVWAQWTLTRTLLVQTLFLQMGWHLGLYFLPIFVLASYFHSMQAFLTNLLKNYFAMMVAGFIMASVGLILFSPTTWIGTQVGNNYQGGIIQMAFAGTHLSLSNNGFNPGSFPYMAQMFMEQVARGQIVWMLGACGIILGQVYDLVRNVLDGGFRSTFQAGGAGSGVVFGGK